MRSVLLLVCMFGFAGCVTVPDSAKIEKPTGTSLVDLGNFSEGASAVTTSPYRIEIASINVVAPEQGDLILTEVAQWRGGSPLRWGNDYDPVRWDYTAKQDFGRYFKEGFETVFSIADNATASAQISMSFEFDNSAETNDRCSEWYTSVVVVADVAITQGVNLTRKQYAGLASDTSCIWVFMFPQEEVIAHIIRKAFRELLASMVRDPVLVTDS